MRKPPEDPATKLLRALSDIKPVPADVVSFAQAKERRLATEEAEIQAIEDMPIQQVRKKLIQDGLDLNQVDGDAKRLAKTIQKGALVKPQQG